MSLLKEDNGDDDDDDDDRNPSCTPLFVLDSQIQLFPSF
jgi:hypothetical protein